MAALAAALKNALPTCGLAPDAVNCVIEIMQAENDQMRLSLDGGFPWETVRTERKISLKCFTPRPAGRSSSSNASMIPALLLPPRWFYAGRHWLGTIGWYRNIRTDVLPMPRVSTAASSKEFKV